MKNKQRWILVSLMIVISMVFAACGSSESSQAPEPTTAPEAPATTVVEEPTQVPEQTEPEESKLLRVRLIQDIQNLDPAFIVGPADEVPGRAVFEGLTAFASDSNDIQNHLAEWLNMSEDGLEIHFKLREGVQFHRGYGELTTEDVKFSFERFRDPELASPYADDWISLDYVEIIDKYEGKIHLKEPQATLWTNTLPLSSGHIVSKRYVEEVGMDAFATDIVGTGPYTFEEWIPGERVSLKANPDYWGESASWDEVRLLPIDDDKAAEVAFEAGEVDFSEVSLASADRYQSQSGMDVMVVPTGSYAWVGMNVENPKLQDMNVRMAIRYGIDVPSIVIATYLGMAEQANTMIPPGVLGHWEDAPVYERDVEKAKDYLAEAGLESLDLELAILDTTEYRTWAEIIQQNLAEVGINITIVSLDPSTFWVLGDGDKGKDVDLFTMTYTAGMEPAWYTMWFTCDQVGVWNWMRWCSPEYDELHMSALSILTPEGRQEKYVEMEKLWDEAAHTVWITHQPRAYAHSTDIVPNIYPGGQVPRIREFKPAD
jgi:peptide/nickel transport system substrate-binding protein